MSRHYYNKQMITCYFPDFASNVAFYLREWPTIFTVAFFALSLFHRQWVIFFFSHWMNLGNLVVSAFARLYDKEVMDPYCVNFYWRPFPSVVCFSVGGIVGFALLYTILWDRKIKFFMTIYCVILAAAVPVLVIVLGITAAWQAVVSVLMGMAWGGAYAGAVRIAGPLVWSSAQHSSIFHAMGFKTDDWSTPAPYEDDKNHVM